MQKKRHGIVWAQAMPVAAVGHGSCWFLRVSVGPVVRHAANPSPRQLRYHCTYAAQLNASQKILLHLEWIAKNSLHLCSGENFIPQNSHQTI